MARCDSYIKGECTWGACERASWLPEWLGNANQWLANAAARGFPITDIPTVGSIAVFNDASLYDPQFGHDAYVYEVLSYDSFHVQEMNFAEWNRYDFRWADRTGLLGFILNLGALPGLPPPPPIGPVPTADRDRANLAWSSFAAIYDLEWPGRIDDLRAIQARARALMQG